MQWCASAERSAQSASLTVLVGPPSRANRPEDHSAKPWQDYHRNFAS